MRSRLYFIFVLLLTLTALPLATPLRAQSVEDLAVSEETFTLVFPRSLNVKATLRLPDTPIVSARIVLLPLAGSRRIPKEVEIPADAQAQVSVDYTFDFVADTIFVYPFMWYDSQWEVTDANGVVHVSARTTRTLEDNSHAFNSASAGKIVVHWYDLPADYGQRMLESATQMYDRLEAQFGINSPLDTHLIVYNTPEDFCASIQFSGCLLTEVASSVVNYGYFPGTAIFVLREDQEFKFFDQWVAEAVGGSYLQLLLELKGRSTGDFFTYTWFYAGIIENLIPSMQPLFLQLAQQYALEDRLIPFRLVGESYRVAFSNADSNLQERLDSQTASAVAYLYEQFGQDAAYKIIQQTTDQRRSFVDAFRAVTGITPTEFEARWRQSVGAPPLVVQPTPVLAFPPTPTFKP